jgi:hypothetical protein
MFRIDNSMLTEGEGSRPRLVVSCEVLTLLSYTAHSDLTVVIQQRRLEGKLRLLEHELPSER